MSTNYDYQYLVAFIHSEGIDRAFVTMPRRVNSQDSITQMEAEVQRGISYYGVKIFSFQLIGTVPCVRR